MVIYKKIRYVILNRYNPYPFYWFDLITERHLKNRVGECKDCLECCKYNCSCIKTIKSGCYCQYADLKTKRCNIYENRNCDIWFPISPKELDYFKGIKRDFKCNYSFKK